MVKVLAVVLLAGAGLVLALARAWPSYAEAPVVEASRRAAEAPWFTREALAQVFDEERGFGPLFEGSVVGRSAPSPETRARIAAFAKQHGVTLDLEIRDDELRSVTLDIVFGGCCGYEGVDLMARSLGRPNWAECCGCTGTYVDNWVIHTEDARIRFAVRVNRLTLHWEPLVELPVLLARMDALLGQRAEAVARSQGTRWREIEPELFLLEQPFPFTNRWESAAPGWRDRYDLGAQVRVSGGVIIELAFHVPILHLDEVHAAMRAQWGAPRRDDAWAWQLRDREITTDTIRPSIVIRTR